MEHELFLKMWRRHVELDGPLAHWLGRRGVLLIDHLDVDFLGHLSERSNSARGLIRSELILKLGWADHPQLLRRLLLLNRLLLLELLHQLERVLVATRVLQLQNLVLQLLTAVVDG